MDVELRAVMDLHPGQIAVDFNWIGPAQRPDLRLVRRQLRYPLNPEDGYLVFALREWFSPSGDPWAKLSSTQYLLPNALREGGLVQSEVAYAFANQSDLKPAQIFIRIYDAGTGGLKEVRIGDITRVVETKSEVNPWSQVQTIEIFMSPGGGPEATAGKIVVSRGNSDTTKPDEFAWLAPTLPAISAPFDKVRQEETEWTVLAKDGHVLRLQAVSSTDRRPGTSALLDE